LLIKSKNIQVTEDEVKAYFDKNKDKLKSPEQIRVSHIVVETEREAKDLLIAIKAGADFGLLAKAKSIDTSTKDKGGDLGFFSKGTFLPTFETAAFGLKKVGDISDVVKTSLGYHIIKLEDRKESKLPELTHEIKEKIKQILHQQKITAKMPIWIQELRNKAKIEIIGIQKPKEVKSQVNEKK
jgi:foldase protein PrsA